MPTLMRLCAKTEAPEGRALLVRLPGHEPLAVCKVDGAYFCVSDTCSHGLASLSEGEVEDGQIFCPFHGGSFDVRTGKAVERPCTTPIATYPVVEDGDALFIEVLP